MSNDDLTLDLLRARTTGHLGGAKNTGTLSTGPLKVSKVLSKEFEQAQAGTLSVEEFVRLKRNNLSEIASLAADFYGKERYDDSLYLFKELIAINENDARYHNAVGAVLIQQKDYEGAISYLNNALELNSESISAIVNRAEAYLLTNRFEEAYKDLEKAIALDPDEKSPAANRGRHLALGMAKIAESLKATAG
ncbi:MAG: tetratricopeptide repeat protein [Blastocatellia bacterium]|nr:tetratricopeptide repeat protein [Blastocatellia bacterium]